MTPLDRKILNVNQNYLLVLQLCHLLLSEKETFGTKV